MWRDLTFCQFFLRRDTKKLMPREEYQRPARRLRGRKKRRTEHDVGKNLVLSHLDVADSDTQAENLLELELDGRADLGQLVGKVFSMRYRGREFSSYIFVKSGVARDIMTLHTLRKTRTQETRNLLDESFRGQEGVVLLGELLDKLLVFVKPEYSIRKSSSTSTSRLLTSSNRQPTCTRAQSA